MADRELVKEAQRVEAQLHDRRERAERMMERRGDSFDLARWAFGEVKDIRYPYSPPYQPIVIGVPTMGQAFRNFNMRDYARIGVAAFFSFAGGFIGGKKVIRFSPISPTAMGVFFALGCSTPIVFSSLATSGVRLMGYLPNGRPLQPGFENWKEDHVPLFVKTKTGVRGESVQGRVTDGLRA